MVEELLKSNYQINSVFTTLAGYKSMENNAKLSNYNKECTLISEGDLQKISLMTTPNEVLALAEIPEEVNITKIPSDEWILMPENIQDPGNLGSILRIADWFAIDKIILSEDSPDVYNPKTVQASMGSIFRVQTHRADLCGLLKENIVPVYGAVLEGNSIYNTSLKEKGIIVLGNESKGISETMFKMIDRPISIPRYGRAESLNVAMAASVICAEIRRRES